MRRIYKFISVSFFLVLSCTGYCQNKSLINEEIEGRVIDTLEINENNVVVRVYWMADTFKVTIQNEIRKYDFEEMNEKLGEKHAIRTEKERQSYMQILKLSGQNCYSYALEKYFSCNDLAEQTVYNKRTRIGLKGIHQVVDNCFEEIMSLPTHPKRNLKIKLPENVLLAFFNKSDWIIHAVYYSNGIFYTKNGVFKASEFSNLKKFLKENYWDTITIKAYRFDKSRLNLSPHS